MLDRASQAGRYDISDPDQLIERLNSDLHQVTPDKHLHVMYDPAKSKELASRPPKPGRTMPRRRPRISPPPSTATAAWCRCASCPETSAISKPIGFVWAGDVTERAYDDAMRFLSGGDAVIIDMRKNGGGSPDAVRYLVSHFLAPNTTLMTFYIGSNRADTPRRWRRRAPRGWSASRSTC